MRRPDDFSSKKTTTRSRVGSRRPNTAQAVVREATKRRQKAEKAEFKGFTQATRHRRRVWAASIASITVVVLATVVLVLSPALALREVRVEGSTTVAEAEIQEALAGLYGEPLARISNDRVATALKSIRVIQAFETRIEPPGTLVIILNERQPLGAVSLGGVFVVVDAAAVELWSQPEPPENLPIILVKADRSSPSFEAVARVLLALPPEIASSVEGVTASTLDDVRFTMRESSHEVIWGSAERSREKARVLGAALVAAGAGQPQVIDVTTPDSVVVRQQD
jgi:cell division protein FtsQ